MDEMIMKIVKDVTDRLFKKDPFKEVIISEIRKKNLPILKNNYRCYCCNIKVFLVKKIEMTENTKKFCSRCESKMTYFKMFGFSMPERN